VSTIDARSERPTSPLPRHRTEDAPGVPVRRADAEAASAAPAERRLPGIGASLTEAELFAGYGVRLGELGGVPEVIHELREVVHTSRTLQVRIVDERPWTSRPRGRDSA